MRVPRVLAVAVLGAIALAACGSSNGTNQARGNGSYAAAPATQATAAPSSSVTVTTASTSLGTVLVDGSGRTLYGRTSDKQGQSSCDGTCATAWPPLTVPSSALPAGLDAKLFSTVKRTDGTWQLRAGTWPLYRFAGDVAAGDTNGQGSGGVWFVVAPDGKLVKR